MLLAARKASVKPMPLSAVDVIPAISFAKGSSVEPPDKSPWLVKTVSPGNVDANADPMLAPVPPYAARLAASAAMIGSTPAAIKFC
jgi:hypothetical protein